MEKLLETVTKMPFVQWFLVIGVIFLFASIESGNYVDLSLVTFLYGTSATVLRIICKEKLSISEGMNIGNLVYLFLQSALFIIWFVWVFQILDYVSNI